MLLLLLLLLLLRRLLLMLLLLLLLLLGSRALALLRNGFGTCTTTLEPTVKLNF